MSKKIKIISSIFFLANLFLISPVFAQWNPASVSGFGLPSGSVYAIIAGILTWILRVFFLVGLIGFAVSGIMYLTASGDEGQVGKAKNAMKYSIIGVVVGLSGYVIIQAATRMLSGTGTGF